MLSPARPSLLGGTWTILRARWQVARNSFWRGKLIRKVTTLLLILIVGAVSYGLYRFSRFIVASLQRIARVQPELIAQLGSLDRVFAAVPSIALGIFGLPLLLSSVSFALSTLYLARDLDTLLVTPVPVRAVFLARFLEGLLPTYLLLFALLAPALTGYGQALGYGLGFWAALVLVLALLPLLPVSIGTLLTMLLVRFIPAKRLRDVLAVVSGLFGLVFYIGSQSLNRFADNLATPQTAERLLRFDLPVLPTSWGARMLIAAGTGNLPNFLFFGALYSLATLGLFVVCLVLSERLYYGGWATLASTDSGRARRRSRVPTITGNGVGSPIRAIIRKDLRILPRDLQQLSQLVFPLAIAGFWIWRLLTDTSAADVSLGASESFTATGLVGIGVFVCVLISSHLGLTGLSREAQGYWLLHLAPISAWTVLWAKWFVAWLPFPVIGTIFVALIGVLQRPGASQLAQDWLLVQLTGLGVAGITAGLGATFPRFDWQQPRRMTSTVAGCLAPVLYFVYTGLMLLLTAGMQFIPLDWGSWVYALGWGIAVLLTALAFGLPLLLGAARLRDLQL